MSGCALSQTSTKVTLIIFFFDLVVSGAQAVGPDCPSRWPLAALPSRGAAAATAPWIARHRQQFDRAANACPTNVGPLLMTNRSFTPCGGTKVVPTLPNVNARSCGVGNHCPAIVNHSHATQHPRARLRPPTCRVFSRRGPNALLWSHDRCSDVGVRRRSASCPV